MWWSTVLAWAIVASHGHRRWAAALHDMLQRLVAAWLLRALGDGLPADAVDPGGPVDPGSPEQVLVALAHRRPGPARLALHDQVGALRSAPDGLAADTAPHALGVLSLAAADLDDRAAADELRGLVRPHAALVCGAGYRTFVGTAALHLGRLAAVAGDGAEAERHLATALRQLAPLRALPWIALTQLTLADVLEARGRSSDRGWIVALRAEAGWIADHRRDFGSPTVAVVFGRCVGRSTIPGALAAALLLAACSSDSSDSDEADSAEAADRLSTAVERVEQADGLRVQTQILYFAEGRESATTEPDAATCVNASFEPEGTAESGERLYANFGTPHENFAGYGCLLDVSFTVDGTRVYSHTDERAPGTEHGLLSRVGETTPELIDEMGLLDTGSGTELAGLVETATGTDQVDDLTAVFELDPDEVAGLAPPEAATEEPADTVTLTATYASDPESGPEAVDRLASLEYEVTAGPSLVVMTYLYDRYGQAQDVEIPVAPYITADVTQLATLDELRDFLGLDQP